MATVNKGVDLFVPSQWEQELELGERNVREGRFQRWLSLIAGGSAILAGLEVSYEHYRGSYSNRIMYTPVALSGALAAGGIWGFFNRWAATYLLRAISVVSLADSIIGFGFHLRGIQRKPAGWRLPVFNVIMGPRYLRLCCFGVSAYLGLVASYLRREENGGPLQLPKAAHENHWLVKAGAQHEHIDWRQDIREGRFQKHLAVATAISAFFSGFEALYSHYKNNFRYAAQWTPIVVAPCLMGAAAVAVRNRRAAHTLLPALSALAIINGGVGFFYHARGVLRRPAGLKKPVYNVIYGPPIFAPLLFAASGFLGLLASLMRREKA